MPAVKAAGSAGGTVMVMMSRDSMMMVLAGTYGQVFLGGAFVIIYWTVLRELCQERQREREREEDIKRIRELYDFRQINLIA